ncbi:hypothetical protein FBQ96_01835 [Nitrospirales bacterium NOB]|nr:hypothetical protein [Nitrospirales bacterium NOB]
MECIAERSAHMLASFRHELHLPDHRELAEVVSQSTAGERRLNTPKREHFRTLRWVAIEH